jgi:hypothetical protein
MKVILGLLMTVILVNLAVLDITALKPKEIKPDSAQCPTGCDQKIQAAIAAIPTTPIVPTQVTAEPTIKQIVKAKAIRSTSYVPIPGSGSTGANKWESLPGTEFYLNTADYGGLREARLEVNMKLFNGNGLGYVRLFDKTSGIEVWGSEVSSKNQSFTTIISDKMTLRPGNRLYEIQAKSLTADTTIFNSGRIKLITEN